MKQGENILTSKDDIKDFMGITGDRMFRVLINAGMPVKLIGSSYHAHKKNLDIWWELFTREGGEIQLENSED